MFSTMVLKEEKDTDEAKSYQTAFLGKILGSTPETCQFGFLQIRKGCFTANNRNLQNLSAQTKCEWRMDQVMMFPHLTCQQWVSCTWTEFSWSPTGAWEQTQLLWKVKDGFRISIKRNAWAKADSRSDHVPLPLRPCLPWDFRKLMNLTGSPCSCHLVRIGEVGRSGPN